MTRLIAVSNRVSRPQPGTDGNQGGLAVALGDALRTTKGMWFGWSGEQIDQFTGDIHIQEQDGVTFATIDLEPQDIEEYYNGFANKTLWPLFHYRIGLTEYDRSFRAGYTRVNQRFADTLMTLIQPDDMIWIHDYHLIPLASELRQRGVANRIGFFLHIPWCPADLLTTLPEHEGLVETLFDYDLIGFQTEEWVESFIDYILRGHWGKVSTDGFVEAFGKRSLVAAFPIGIDAKAFRVLSESAVAQEYYDLMRESIGKRKMIMGVDRLDYSKGIEERFAGYERFLADNPHRCKEVFLLQIAPPSRSVVQTYQQIRANLDGLSGRINGAYADVDWVPVRYVNRGYARDQLAGIYRAAAVGYVTPLRDGMNLVAKEYVAAQAANDPGVLILSQFAGAARQMTDALLVNPHSPEELSEAIARGLDMPLAERRRRWECLLHGVLTDNVDKWREDFMTQLNGVSRNGRAA